MSSENKRPCLANDIHLEVVSEINDRILLYFYPVSPGFHCFTGPSFSCVSYGCSLQFHLYFFLIYWYTHFCIIFIPLITASFQILMILRFLSHPVPSFESRPMHPTAYRIFLFRHSCKSVTPTYGEIIKLKSTPSPVHFVSKAAIQQILDACFLADPL